MLLEVEVVTVLISAKAFVKLTALGRVTLTVAVPEVKVVAGTRPRCTVTPLKNSTTYHLTTTLASATPIVTVSVVALLSSQVVRSESCEPFAATNWQITKVLAGLTEVIATL